MSQRKWVIRFTDGSETRWYGQLRVHENVLYAEQFGGVTGMLNKQRAFPLVNIKEWAPDE